MPDRRRLDLFEELGVGAGDKDVRRGDQERSKWEMFNSEWGI